MSSWLLSIDLVSKYVIMLILLIYCGLNKIMFADDILKYIFVNKNDSMKKDYMKYTFEDIFNEHW